MPWSEAGSPRITLLDKRTEVDRHGLMRCPDVDLGRSIRLPPEELEEPHIRNLDVRLHDVPASRCCGANRQLHEIHSDMRGAIFPEHCEAIALPPACPVDTVQAHRSNDSTSRVANEMNRLRILVAFIEVGELKQRLVSDEYVVPNRKVTLQLARTAGGPHGEARAGEIRGGAHELGRDPICSGTALGARGSSDLRPEQAWHRAQPAFAVPAFIPRSVMYA